MICDKLSVYKHLYIVRTMTNSQSHTLKGNLFKTGSNRPVGLVVPETRDESSSTMINFMSIFRSDENG